MAEDESTKKLAAILDEIVDLERLTSDAKSLKQKLAGDPSNSDGHLDEVRRVLAELRKIVDSAHRSLEEHFTVKKEDEDEDKKPNDTVKVGTIKLVDLSKLIDPSRAVVTANRRPPTPNRRLPTPNRRPSTPTVVILSDSDVDERPKKRKAAVVANGAVSRRRPQRTAARQVKSALSKIIDSDSSSSVSSLSSDGEAKTPAKKQTKGGKKAAAFDEKGCVDAQTDRKFACKCTVRLTRVPAEKLKEHYMKKRMDSEMTRLFNLKSLKRSRKRHDGSDSSESAPATKKKNKARPASKKKKAAVASDGSGDETVPTTAAPVDESVVDLANDSTVVMAENEEGDEILNTIRSDDEKRSSHGESTDDESSKSKKKDKTSKKESKKKKQDSEKNKTDDDKETAESSKAKQKKAGSIDGESEKSPDKSADVLNADNTDNGEPALTENDHSEDTSRTSDAKKDKEQEQPEVGKGNEVKTPQVTELPKEPTSSDENVQSVGNPDTAENSKKSDEEKIDSEEPSNGKGKKKEQKGKKSEDVKEKEAQNDAVDNGKESDQKSQDNGDKEKVSNADAEKVDSEESQRVSVSQGKDKEDKKKESDSDKDKTDVEDNAEKSKDSDKEEEKQDEKSKRKRKDSSDSSKSESKKKKSKKKVVSSDSDEKKDSDANSEDEKEEKKKKSKWRRDKLLTVALSSESEGEARAKFDRKKEKAKEAKSDEDDDEDDNEKLVVKAKGSSKKKKKRVLTDSEYEGEKDSSTSEKSESEKSASSDDDEAKKAEEKKKSRRRIKNVNDSSEDDEKKSTRKHIRRVLTKDSLAESTLQAEKDEAERKARIADRQKKYNSLFEPDKLEKTTLDKVVLDFNEETEEELLKVDPVMVKHLKPHQGKGIQFMWYACFESLERAKTDKGSGCILAHCMGLGKTLQVVTLLHTLLANEEKTGIRKALVVCPLSTVLNWVAEFKKWLPDDDVVEVFDLVAYKQNRERLFQVKEWHRVGGVMVMGYDMFRNLSREKGNRLPKKMRNELQTMLVDPGPDLVVCDEGHLLKNEKTSISICMNRLRTLRRIVLTGTPLQNNLKEYWCMVQFVKPNLLGTYKEYLNRFVNPITNGQYTDSTQFDIQLMRKRSHVLHKMLDGIVQRRDYSVLAPFLPPKYEYVLFISLTETQLKLYKHYLDNFARRQSSSGRSSFLFVDFQELQRICTHPRVLLDKSIENKIAQEKKDLYDDEESEGSLKDFIDDDDSEEEESSSSNSSSGSEKGGSSEAEKKGPKSSKGRRRTRAMAQDDPIDVDAEEPEKEEPSEWWRQFTAGDELDNIVVSGKLHLLFEILQQCELMGDKVLVFSQSLYSLSVIEYFLQKIDEATQNGDNTPVSGYTGSWALGLDYFRLDGSSSCDNRAAWCNTFNDPENSRARLFLISTRAGGLGINLVAANRVIIFDVSWNPSHDVQSIYRVYRFGQSKPSYIYRFVTLGTMEMKIYERQVMKQSISKRVIDEQQIDRHYNQNDLAELYKFEPQPEEERPLPMVPKDVLLGELVHNFDKLIYKYHEHQSLLENKQDEELNEEERKAAWEEFENEKKNRGNLNALSGDSISMYFGGTPVHQIVASISSIIKREHPDMNVMQINNAIPMVIQEMKAQLTNGDSTIHSKIMTELRVIQYQQQKKMQEIYQFQKMFEKYQQQMSSGPNPMDPSSILAQFQRQFGLNTYPSASNRATPAPMPRNIDPNEVVRIDD